MTIFVHGNVSLGNKPEFPVPRGILLTIGKLAADLGLHPDTIRKYEREGLIPLAHRSPINGYRVWSHQEAAQIQQAIFGRSQPPEGADPTDA